MGSRDKNVSRDLAVLRFLRYCIVPLARSRSIYIISVLLPLVLAMQYLGVGGGQWRLTCLSIAAVGAVCGLMTVSMVRIPPSFTEYLVVYMGSRNLVRGLWLSATGLSIIMGLVAEAMLTLLLHLFGTTPDALYAALGLLTSIFAAGLTATLMLLGSVIGFTVVLILSLIQPLIVRLTIPVLSLSTRAVALALFLAYAIPSTSIIMLLNVLREERLKKLLVKAFRYATFVA